MVEPASLHLPMSRHYGVGDAWDISVLLRVPVYG